MPLFSILCTAAVERPERCASWASDQPRSERARATFAPISETVSSIWGSAACGSASVAIRFLWYTRISGEAKAPESHFQSGLVALSLDSGRGPLVEWRPRSYTAIHRVLVARGKRLQDA